MRHFCYAHQLLNSPSCHFYEIFNIICSKITRDFNLKYLSIYMYVCPE